MQSLVLSGGSALGSYQVGALKYAVHVLGMQFSSVYGVSVGALNGGKIVMHPREEISQAVELLEKDWLNLGNSGVYKRHCPFGMLHVLGARRSLYDLSPLREKIAREFHPTLVQKNGYRFGVGVTSYRTGKYRVVKDDDPKIVDYIYASCAQAVAFPPAEIDGEWWMDGGPRNAVPLKEALDSGAEKILMILTEASEVSEVVVPPRSGLDVGLRALQLLAHEVFINDVPLALGDSDAEVLVVRPQAPLMADPLDFGKDQARRLIGRGYEDAAQQLGRAA